MIELQGVSCGYHGGRVVHDVTFTAPGHLTVLGPNGAGKSTLAKALCGLLGYEGSIRIDGHELRDLDGRELAREVAYIPAKLDIFDLHTMADEFILLGRYPFKRAWRDYGPEDYEAVEHAARRLGIEELLASKVHELSSGQQQLILIAQALCQQSRTLIFDEPTANLDPAHTAAFVAQLQSLQQSCQTLLITHDLQLAMRMGAPVLFVDGGGAQFYEESADFFTEANLEACYGVPFSVTEHGVGVRYG